MTVKHVLSACVLLSEQLQASSCNLLQAAAEAEVVKTQVEAERIDPLVWHALFEKALGMASSIDVEPTFPRVERQQNRPNAPAANAFDYWRVNMYLPFVDHLLTELQQRLLQRNERYVIQYILPNRIGDLSYQRAEEIFTAAQEDLAVNKETFVRECQRWKTRCEHTQLPLSLESVLIDLPDDLYPNVARRFHLLLAMAVPTASSERSFSSMRRLKTYLRSTMTSKRMSGLGLLNVHKDRELNAATVIDMFAQRKNRRLALLFNDN
ncbi:52 kDa repressor of the inhibitor of the protein kinase-like [Mya arenaria]|uniref:52 kDa repressor of the inhibitor of the protein kinase-like n=1 Tax=Mya arenaria TaxID=6604 RepID=UPI0022E4EF42|nr:52 kDa repressor of the inhibitor of the protein kinase-like [Mya arenaria]